MELVDEAFAEGDELPATVAAELRETALGMARFPMGSWLHKTRGCGCVVGEWMVRNRGVDREQHMGCWTYDVATLVGVDGVTDFGQALDLAIGNECDVTFEVLLIEDGGA